MLPESFHPRPSRGHLSLYLVTALLGFAATRSLATGGLLLGFVLTAVAAYLLSLALCFPMMRYEVSGTTLTAEYGPLLRFRIPLHEISKVSRVDLSPSFFVALAMPGIALYGVRCAGVGRVRMCATATVHNVYLVETRRGRRYGFTPADDRAFLSALHRHGVINEYR